MSCYAGPEIVNDGLVLCLDATNTKSYPGTGNTWFDLSGNGNNGSSTSLSTTNESVGTVMRLDNTSAITIPLNQAVDKYSFTFSYWGRSTAIPIGNYRRIWRLIEPNAPHGYYFIGDTREVATPSVLHYVKDYSVNIWDSRSVLPQADFLNFQWNNYVLIVTAENNWLSYRNGVLLGTNTTPSQDLTQYGNITSIDFGGVDTKFNISNVTLYNRILTADEVSANFNALRGRYGL
jgi:hypothetical protein